MNDFFEVPNERLNRNPQASFQLDTNVYRGFKTAVSNNQMRIALEYLLHVVDILTEKIAELEGSVSPVEAPAATTKKAAGRSVKAAAAAEAEATEAADKD